MAALVGSGMSLERFAFFGFLPRKGKERGEMLSEIVDSRVTVVLFEAPNRVAATLEALIEAGAGERTAVVARELTKKFEEFKRGTIAELAAVYGKADPKGEVVLVIGGTERRTVSESELADAARKLRASGKAPRDVMDYLVSSLGASRNAAYRVAHEDET
jgi:16S rRNA (cytidine1402-2'-O)-methyltransferase